MKISFVFLLCRSKKRRKLFEDFPLMQSIVFPFLSLFFVNKIRKQKEMREAQSDVDGET